MKHKDYEALSKAHFDGQAAEYDIRDTMYYSKYPKISCKDVAARLKNTAYDSLLDIGCGTGYLIEMLAKRTAAQYYGLDLSPKMLEAASARLHGSAQLTEGSAQRLPYADSQFDVVTCVQSFHHYPDPDKALAEAWRVLKPNGLYILSDSGCTGFLKWIDNHFFMKLMKSGDFAVYSLDDAAKMLQHAGFKVQSEVWIAKTVFTIIAQKP